MHTDLRISLCSVCCRRSTAPPPRKALINALAGKVFHFVIPPARLEAFPFALRQFVLLFLAFILHSLCVYVYVCVCVRKAARAFHHRHNLNSNINNLKWFVFFSILLPATTVTVYLFPLLSPSPSRPTVAAAGCLRYTSLQMLLLPLVAAAAAEGTWRCRLSAFFT